MGKKTKKVASEVEALKAEVARLRKEVASLRTLQDAKLKAEIESLHKKIHTELEQAEQRAERDEKDAKEKVIGLERKAAKAGSKAKADVEAGLVRVRKKAASLKTQKDYEEPEDRPSVY